MYNKTIVISQNLTVDDKFYDFLMYADDRISAMIRSIETCSIINYIAICDKPDTITFLPSNKNKVGIDPFKSNSRTYLRIGRLIYKLFDKKILDEFRVTDYEVEKFVNKFKSFFDTSNIKFEIISGEMIRKYYLDRSYFIPSGVVTGSLWKSCMRYIDRQKFLDLYTRNNDIQMLVMLVKVNDDMYKLRGRALLWNVKTEENINVKIMDRIYSVFDSDIYTFKRWASENGYISKMEQNSKSQGFFDVNGISTNIKLHIKLENYIFTTYPYLDTFCYFNYSDGILYNYDKSSSFFKLNQANGTLITEDEELDIDDEIIDDDF